jgi:hypothetical protein
MLLHNDIFGKNCMGLWFCLLTRLHGLVGEWGKEQEDSFSCAGLKGPLNAYL